MSFPKYPEYKDSGVEWLGEVPAHWSLCRFKQIFQERAGRSKNGNEELLSVSAYWGVRPRTEMREDGDHLTRADSLEGYKLCDSGELVMNIMLAWNRGLGFAWQRGIVSPAYSVFSVIDESETKFLDYLVRSDEYTLYFKAFSAGVIDSRLRLYPETFGSLRCALPHRKEQATIAAFLDSETARIDALVAEQQRLIELLKEKRQAVISHAVTKGLNPDVPMKDSGVEWLGEVPEHWGVKRIKHLCRSSSDSLRPGPFGSHIKGDDFVGESDFRVYNQATVISGDFEKSAFIQEPKYLELLAFGVRPNDILLTSRGTIGKVAVAPSDLQRGVIHPCLIRLRLDEGSVFLPYFQLFFGETELAVEQLRLASNSTTIDVVYAESLANVWLALPPLDEQKEIVTTIWRTLQVTDSTIDTSHQQVSLLQERRSALISAAVTGKIDVRDWQPPPGSSSPTEATATEPA